jgi:tetratricopeptide (TPR) repeat protein
MQRFFDERRRSQSGGRPPMLTTLPEQSGAAPVTVMPSLPSALPSVRESRALAERAFRRALSLDPSLAEARIRLAHLLGDGGRHDRAAAELARLAPETLPSMLAYYAALLTGREARALGRFTSAREAFTRAATLYPNAPAPRHGLSELAMAQGDPAASLAHLDRASTAAEAAVDEPWWWIDRVHDPSAETLIGDLRRLAPR